MLSISISQIPTITRIIIILITSLILLLLPSPPSSSSLFASAQTIDYQDCSSGEIEITGGALPNAAQAANGPHHISIPPTCARVNIHDCSSNGLVILSNAVPENLVITITNYKCTQSTIHQTICISILKDSVDSASKANITIDNVEFDVNVKSNPSNENIALLFLPQLDLVRALTIQNCQMYGAIDLPPQHGMLEVALVLHGGDVSQDIDNEPDITGDIVYDNLVMRNLDPFSSAGSETASRVTKISVVSAPVYFRKLAGSIYMNNLFIRDMNSIYSKDDAWHLAIFLLARNTDAVTMEFAKLQNSLFSFKNSGIKNINTIAVDEDPLNGKNVRVDLVTIAGQARVERMELENNIISDIGLIRSATSAVNVNMFVLKEGMITPDATLPNPGPMASFFMKNNTIARLDSVKCFSLCSTNVGVLQALTTPSNTNSGMRDMVNFTIEDVFVSDVTMLSTGSAGEEAALSVITMNGVVAREEPAGTGVIKTLAIRNVVVDKISVTSNGNAYIRAVVQTQSNDPPENFVDQEYSSISVRNAKINANSAAGYVHLVDFPGKIGGTTRLKARSSFAVSNLAIEDCEITRNDNELSADPEEELPAITMFQTKGSPQDGVSSFGKLIFSEFLLNNIRIDQQNRNGRVTVRGIFFYANVMGFDSRQTSRFTVDNIIFRNVFFAPSAGSRALSARGTDGVKITQFESYGTFSEIGNTSFTNCLMESCGVNSSTIDLTASALSQYPTAHMRLTSLLFISRLEVDSAAAGWKKAKSTEPGNHIYIRNIVHLNNWVLTVGGDDQGVYLRVIDNAPFLRRVNLEIFDIAVHNCRVDVSGMFSGSAELTLMKWGGGNGQIHFLQGDDEKQSIVTLSNFSVSNTIVKTLSSGETTASIYLVRFIADTIIRLYHRFTVDGIFVKNAIAQSTTSNGKVKILGFLCESAQMKGTNLENSEYSISNIHFENTLVESGLPPVVSSALFGDPDDPKNCPYQGNGPCYFQTVTFSNFFWTDLTILVKWGSNDNFEPTMLSAGCPMHGLSNRVFDSFNDEIHRADYPPPAALFRQTSLTFSNFRASGLTLQNSGDHLAPSLIRLYEQIGFFNKVLFRDISATEFAAPVSAQLRLEFTMIDLREALRGIEVQHGKTASTVQNDNIVDILFPQNAAPIEPVMSSSLIMQNVFLADAEFLLTVTGQAAKDNEEPLRVRLIEFSSSKAEYRLEGFAVNLFESISMENVSVRSRQSTNNAAVQVQNLAFICSVWGPISPENRYRPYGNLMNFTMTNLHQNNVTVLCEHNTPIHAHIIIFDKSLSRSTNVTFENLTIRNSVYDAMVGGDTTAQSASQESFVMLVHFAKTNLLGRFMDFEPIFSDYDVHSTLLISSSTIDNVVLRFYGKASVSAFAIYSIGTGQKPICNFYNIIFFDLSMNDLQLHVVAQLAARVVELASLEIYTYLTTEGIPGYINQGQYNNAFGVKKISATNIHINTNTTTGFVDVMLMHSRQSITGFTFTSFEDFLIDNININIFSPDADDSRWSGRVLVMGLKGLEAANSKIKAGGTSAVDGAASTPNIPRRLPSSSWAPLDEQLATPSSIPYGSSFFTVKNCVVRNVFVEKAYQIFLSSIIFLRSTETPGSTELIDKFTVVTFDQLLMENITATVSKFATDGENGELVNNVEAIVLPELLSLRPVRESKDPSLPVGKTDIWFNNTLGFTNIIIRNNIQLISREQAETKVSMITFNGLVRDFIISVFDNISMSDVSITSNPSPTTTKTPSRIQGISFLFMITATLQAHRGVLADLENRDNIDYRGFASLSFNNIHFSNLQSVAVTSRQGLPLENDYLFVGIYFEDHVNENSRYRRIVFTNLSLRDSAFRSESTDTSHPVQTVCLVYIKNTLNFETMSNSQLYSKFFYKRASDNNLHQHHPVMPAILRFSDFMLKNVSLSAVGKEVQIPMVVTWYVVNCVHTVLENFHAEDVRVTSKSQVATFTFIEILRKWDALDASQQFDSLILRNETAMNLMMMDTSSSSSGTTTAPTMSSLQLALETLAPSFTARDFTAQNIYVETASGYLSAKPEICLLRIYSKIINHLFFSVERMSLRDSSIVSSLANGYMAIMRTNDNLTSYSFSSSSATTTTADYKLPTMMPAITINSLFRKFTMRNLSIINTKTTAQTCASCRLYVGTPPLNAEHILLENFIIHNATTITTKDPAIFTGGNLQPRTSIDLISFIRQFLLDSPVDVQPNSVQQLSLPSSSSSSSSSSQIVSNFTISNCTTVMEDGEGFGVHGQNLTSSVAGFSYSGDFELFGWDRFELSDFHINEIRFENSIVTSNQLSAIYFPPLRRDVSPNRTNVTDDQIIFQNIVVENIKYSSSSSTDLKAVTFVPPSTSTANPLGGNHPRINFIFKNNVINTTEMEHIDNNKKSSASFCLLHILSTTELSTRTVMNFSLNILVSPASLICLHEDSFAEIPSPSSSSSSEGVILEIENNRYYDRPTITSSSSSSSPPPSLLRYLGLSEHATSYLQSSKWFLKCNDWTSTVSQRFRSAIDQGSPMMNAFICPSSTRSLSASDKNASASMSNELTLSNQATVSNITASSSASLSDTFPTKTFNITPSLSTSRDTDTLSNSQSNPLITRLIKDAISQTVRNVGILITGLNGGASATNARKIQAVVAMADCGKEDISDDEIPEIELDSNPLTLRVGSRRFDTYRGSIVGASLFIFLWGTLMFLIAWIRTQIEYGCSLKRALRKIGFPGTLSVPAFSLLPVAVNSASAMMMRYNSSGFEEDSTMDITIVAFGFVTGVAVPVIVLIWVLREVKRHEKLEIPGETTEIEKSKREAAESKRNREKKKKSRKEKNNEKDSDDDVDGEIAVPRWKYWFDWLTEPRHEYKKTKFSQSWGPVFDFVSFPIFIILSFLLTVGMEVAEGTSSLCSKGDKTCCHGGVLSIIAFCALDTLLILFYKIPFLVRVVWVVLPICSIINVAMGALIYEMFLDSTSNDRSLASGMMTKRVGGRDLDLSSEKQYAMADGGASVVDHTDTLMLLSQISFYLAIFIGFVGLLNELVGAVTSGNLRILLVKRRS